MTTPGPTPELDPVAIDRVRFAMMLLVASTDDKHRNPHSARAELCAELAQRGDATAVAVAVADLAVAWMRRVGPTTLLDTTDELRKLAAALATVN